MRDDPAREESYLANLRRELRAHHVFRQGLNLRRARILADDVILGRTAFLAHGGEVRNLFAGRGWPVALVRSDVEAARAIGALDEPEP